MKQLPEGWRDDRIAGVIKLIESLNEIGYTIVKIEHVYYAIIGDFQPATEITHITTLRGSNISNIILNTMTVAKDSVDALLKIRLRQEIDSLPSLRREYHKDVRWIKFVAKGA